MKTIINIALVLLLLTFSTAFGQSSPLKRAQFTTQISHKEPTDNINQIENSFTTLTYFTEFKDCKGCKIAHQWWFQGKMQYEQKGKAKHDRYRWWSRKTVNPNNPGTWTVKVLINGRVVKTSSINYFVPTRQQQAQETIDKRLKQHTLNECEKKLEYFHQKTKENPDDPYYEFMFRKWGKRCYESAE